MEAFPAFVPLAGVRVAIAGQGEAADAKARLFDSSPAELVRLSVAAALKPEGYAGVRLAFIAGEEDWARRAVAAARAAGAWVNAVDRPELCDFNTPAIVDRGTVVGAVGTVGAAPVLAVRLRQELEVSWPAGLGGVAQLMRALRPAIRAATQDWTQRRRLLGALIQGAWADAALAGDDAAAEQLAREALASGRLVLTAPGHILLFPTPEAADLMTLRAARALGAADRLVLCGPVSPAVLDLARRDAPRETWDGDGARVRAWATRGETVALLGDLDHAASRLPEAAPA